MPIASTAEYLRHSSYLSRHAPPRLTRPGTERHFTGYGEHKPGMDYAPCAPYPPRARGSVYVYTLAQAVESKETASAYALTGV